MRSYASLAIAAILTIAGLAQATPVDMKQVSADAKWAAHLDVDALMASKSAQKVREQILKDHPGAESALAMVKTVWRFDPTTDLHGVTVYGTRLKKDTGVAIVRAKVDQKFLLDLVKLTPEYKTEKYGKYDLHTWVKDGKKHNSTFFQDDVLVFSPSIDELKAALDVLDGTKPNFTTKTPGQPMTLPPGTILAAGAHGLGEAELPCHSPLSKQADVAWIFVGETQGEVFVRGALKVKETETAKKIKAVADGALALASLSKMDDADALKLIDAVKVTLADKVISVEAQAPVDAVWAHIQKEHAKKKAGMKNGGHDKVMKHIHNHFQGK